MLAFAPFNIWVLAFLSPLSLLLLLNSKSWRHSILIGFYYGLGLFGVGTNWVFNSIHEHGQSPFGAAVFITVIFIAALSLFPAVFGLIHARFSANPSRLAYLLMIPSSWTLLEWLRGWLLTGFPWLQLGYSQLESPLASIVPLAGVLSSSWLVMLMSTLLLVLIKSDMRVRLIAVVFLVGLVGGLHLLGKIVWTEPFGEPLKITLVQGNIPQQHKWDADWLLPTIERYEEQTYAHWDSDLIVWPEAALPGYLSDFQEVYLDPLYEIAKSTDTELILGMLQADGEDTFNTVVKLDEQPQIYRKRHLVPFGEYIPLRKLVDVFGGLVTLPAGDISAAEDAVMLTVNGLNVASSICYEDAFGNEMADHFPAAHLLLNISNDAWFGESIAPSQHLQIAQMRSLELGRPMLRANNTAVTAFIDHKGKIIREAAHFKVTSITEEIQPRSGSTPYSDWKNLPVIIFLSVLIVAGLWLARKRKKD